MNKLSVKNHKVGSPSRRPVTQRKTKILSGRITQASAAELKLLYPAHMTESEIINDLVREKLTRAKFDLWIKGIKENLKLNDIDLESFR